MRNIIIIFAAIVIITLCIGNISYSKNDISIKINTDRNKYELLDNITIKLVISNNSDKTIRVADKMFLNSSCSCIKLVVTNKYGTYEYKSRINNDSIPIFYTKIMPHSVLESEFDINSLYEVIDEGEYRIKAIYIQDEPFNNNLENTQKVYSIESNYAKFNIWANKYEKEVRIITNELSAGNTNIFENIFQIYKKNGYSILFYRKLDAKKNKHVRSEIMGTVTDIYSNEDEKTKDGSKYIQEIQGQIPY